MTKSEQELVTAMLINNHCFISAEHRSLLNAARKLEKLGLVRVGIFSDDGKGRVTEYKVTNRFTEKVS